jgi:hypothetical protein
MKRTWGLLQAREFHIIMALQDLKDFLERNRELRVTLKRSADYYVNEAVSKVLHIVQSSGSLPPTSGKLDLMEKYSYRINEAVSRDNFGKAKAFQLSEALRLKDAAALKPRKSNSLCRLKGRLLSVQPSKTLFSERSVSTLMRSPLETKQASSHKGLALALMSTREDAIIAAYTGKKSLKDLGDRYSISPVKIRRAAQKELRSLRNPERRRKLGLIEVRHAVSSMNLKSS